MTTLEYLEKKPALQCRRQYRVPDSSSLKPGSGATEGVLDKGVSGLPDYMHRLDYRSVKIQTQDFGLCPDGTLLCMEDKLGDLDIMFSSL